MNQLETKILAFCGASGTGKTTLLNYIKENYDVEVKELSGRQFLPKNGSYDKTLTDEIQSLIVFNKSINFSNSIFNLLKNNESIVYSRSPLDTIAYSKVLNKAEYFVDLQKEEIKNINDYIFYLYIPIEFEMNEDNDIIRGTNSDVQKSTDEEIKNLLLDKELNIKYCTIAGPLKSRFILIDIIMKEFNINKK